MGIFATIKEKLFGTPSETTAKTTSKTKIPEVDVEAVIEGLVKAKGVKSNWRVSIVDLLTALDLPSSFASRKELAADLKLPDADKYAGTAEQNIWLHKELMKALSENGGKVPKELLK